LKLLLLVYDVHDDVAFSAVLYVSANNVYCMIAACQPHWSASNAVVTCEIKYFKIISAFFDVRLK